MTDIGHEEPHVDEILMIADGFSDEARAEMFRRLDERFQPALVAAARAALKAMQAVQVREPYRPGDDFDAAEQMLREVLKETR